MMLRNGRVMANIRIDDVHYCSMTGTIIYPKMNRKRFVRNLINRGLTKKYAKWLSWYCHNKKIPYTKANLLITFGIPIK